MAVSNTILPSYFGRKAFYLINPVKRIQKRWQRRAATARATVAGQPLSSWYRLLRQRWLKYKRTNAG
jgi:hypothetical protein